MITSNHNRIEFKEQSMRGSPEALVSRLRNRTRRLVAYSILIPIFLGMLAMNWFLLTSMYSQFVPKEGEDPLAHVMMGQSILLGITGLGVGTFGLALVCAFLIAQLVTETCCFTRNDLLVHMYDRLQALEQSRSTSASHQPPQPHDSLNKP
jgi:fatty acid desaturase